MTKLFIVPAFLAMTCFAGSALAGSSKSHGPTNTFYNDVSAYKSPVYTIGSPVVGVNIATVTQTGKYNNSVVKQGNLGQIGIGNAGFISQ